MTFVCIGYVDESSWVQIPESERKSIMAECFAYDEELRASGHYVDGIALQSVRTAATLRGHNGQVSVTDGPFAETKEQLGGIIVLEAENIEQAIQIMSKHPGVLMGSCFEIRPTADLSALLT